MKNIQFILSLICVLSCTCALAGGGSSVVGNGGEGVLLNGELRIRDFYEFPNENPFIGSEIKDYFFKSVSTSTYLGRTFGGIDLNTKLLAQKLTDIEKAIPGLGTALVASIKFHQGRMVDRFDETTLVLDPEDSLPANLAGKRVPIIVRLGQNLTVSDVQFRKLSDVEQVALAIHEFVYSMLNPDCSLGICRQSPRIAREITSRLFSQNSDTDIRLRELVNGFMVLPKKCDDMTPLKISFDFVFNSKNGTKAEFHEASAKSSQAFNAAFEKFCRELENSSDVGIFHFKTSAGDIFSSAKFQSQFGPNSRLIFLPANFEEREFSAPASQCKSLIDKWQQENLIPEFEKNRYFSDYLCMPN